MTAFDKTPVQLTNSDAKVADEDAAHPPASLTSANSPENTRSSLDKEQSRVNTVASYSLSNLKRQHHTKRSFARLLRQLLFVPILHNRWLTTQAKTRLANSVTAAEAGHRGEICLIIENHLPINLAYDTDCLERAIGLFGEHRVWDTAENSGVLVYLNICEHDLEILADRGISAHVAPETWQALCDVALDKMREGAFEQALQELIHSIGTLLRTYYVNDVTQVALDPHGNELSDRIIFYR